jgi:hypothetical protein
MGPPAKRELWDTRLRDKAGGAVKEMGDAL